MKTIFTEIQAPTLITEGSRIQGDLSFLSTTEIHGLVEGNVQQQSLDKVTVGTTGWVRGSVTSKGPIHIDGRVDGDIVSSVKIRLSATACVHGTLTAPQIEVRPGALFEGDFHMKSTRASNKQAASKRAA